jgi:hypothetical protein
MTDYEKLLMVVKTVRSMRQSLSHYQDCESKRAKISVLNVIEGVVLNA